MRTFARIAALVLALFVVFVVGLRAGADPIALPGPLATLAGQDGNSAFNEASRLIRDNYYRPISDAQVQNRSIAGVVSSLNDRFSAYLDPNQYKIFKRGQNPHFSGIGLDVVFSPKGLLATRVFPGSPAKQAGIQVGDTIVSVNGKSLAGKNVSASVALVTGPPGSPVTVGVRQRNGATRVITVKRATINVPSVVAKLVKAPNGRKIGVVALSGFVQGAGAQVASATRTMLKRGATGIVLDLRDNGGGLLDEGVAVASVFIPSGRIVTTRGRHRPTQAYDATGGAISTSVPVVVLVNRNTASASEIVAGAVQDRHRGTVVGTRTFGKGVFQEITNLSNGGALDITVGEFFTPSGRNLGGGGVRTGAGVAPNLNVPQSRGAAAALSAAIAEASK